jgi:hypothetical protein
MTLDEAEEILGTWDEQPPAFLSLARIEAMLAAFLGIKKRPQQVLEIDPVAMLGCGDIHAGLGAAILDFEELKRRHRG